MQLISQFIESLKIGTGQIHRNMTVFPLLRERKEKFDYILLDEALTENLVEITEISEGGSVPELRLKNRAEKPVLIIDGEEFVGAKQNRIANVTILVAAMTTISIPVSCVEQGRWDYRQRDFSSEGRMFTSRGRAQKAVDVSASVQERGDFQADQSAVWDEVEAKAAHFRTATPTMAMGDVFESQRQDLDNYVQVFHCVDHQIGALVAIDGKMAGLDMFAKPETFGTLFPKLVGSYAMDALESVRQNKKYYRPQKSVKVFMEEMKNIKGQSVPSVSLGKDFRFESAKTIGSALVNKNLVLHLCAFPKVKGDGSQTPRRMASLSNRRRKF